MLDAVVLAGATEDVADPALRDTLVAIDELDAIVGQDGVDLVGHCLDQRLEEGRGCEFGGFAIDPGEHELGGAIHSDKQKAFAALEAQLGDVDMEVADLVLLERLGLFTVRLRQP